MRRCHSSSDAGAAAGAAAMLLAGLLCAGVAAAEDQRSGAVVVVVGAHSPARRTTVDELREVYLLRQRLWADGRIAIPVNLPTDHAVREAFSKRVLGRRPAELETYWRRLYLEGVRPPPVLPSPQAVCAYVAVEPAAIGYLPAEAVEAAACRVLLVLDGGS